MYMVEHIYGCCRYVCMYGAHSIGPMYVRGRVFVCTRRYNCTSSTNNQSIYFSPFHSFDRVYGNTDGGLLCVWPFIRVLHTHSAVNGAEIKLSYCEQYQCQRTSKPFALLPSFDIRWLKAPEKNDKNAIFTYSASNSFKKCRITHSLE